MYLPRAFAETDLAALDALIARDNFISLTTVRDSEPTVSHLPVLYRRDGDRIQLRGHWARPNPQATHAGAALAVVHGPQAYVSPGWYTDKEEAARVPTWNYAVAHLRGRLQRYDDEAGLADIVSRLSERFEAAVGSDWRFEPERQDHVSQLRGIVGFRFVPDSVEMKFKLNQNHPEANRRAVAAALATQANADSQALAGMMRQRDP